MNIKYIPVDCYFLLLSLLITRHICHCRPDRQSVNTKLNKHDGEIADQVGNDKCVVGNDKPHESNESDESRKRASAFIAFALIETLSELYGSTERRKNIIF